MKTFNEGFGGGDSEPSRRDVVKYGAAAAIAVAAGPVMAATAANTVSGIAGVLVSNGRHVVKTDAAGRYTLPIDEESIIFVIKPTRLCGAGRRADAAALLLHSPARRLAAELEVALSRHRSQRRAAGLG
jgi:flavoprotein